MCVSSNNRKRNLVVGFTRGWVARPTPCPLNVHAECERIGKRVYTERYSACVLLCVSVISM